MESRESYRTSMLPDLSGRGATAARTLIVAGPLALLGAQLAAALQATSGAGLALSRVAVPLMLAWAAVLFLITRATSPVAAWTGLVAVTLQVTLVQEVTEGWVLLAVESLGFVAFAIALGRLWWVPRVVPVVLVAFPVVDVLTPENASLVQVAGFAGFVAVGLMLAVRMSSAGEVPPEDAAPAPWHGRQSARLTVRSAGVETDPAWAHRTMPPIG